MNTATWQRTLAIGILWEYAETTDAVIGAWNYIGETGYVGDSHRSYKFC